MSYGERSENDEIANQLADAKQELYELQSLIEDLPQLMEERFRRELTEVMYRNQCLARENQILQTQLRQDHLPSGRIPRNIKRPKIHFLRYWSMVSRTKKVLDSCLPATSQLIFYFGILLVCVLISTRLLVPHDVVQRGEGGEKAGPDLTRPSGSNKLPVAGDSQSILEIGASAPTWFEVSDIEGHLLIKDTLDVGMTRKIRLRSGLQLFSARPGLMRYRVDNGEWLNIPGRLGQSGKIVFEPLNARLDSN